MKISVTGENNFIKKNLVENLKTICDGRNRTRTSISISSVSEEAGGDVVISVPDTASEEKKLTVERDGIKTEYTAPVIVGKWDSSGSIVPALCRAVAEDKEYPAFEKSEVLELLFIDDLMEEILDLLEGKPKGKDGKFPKTYHVTLDSVAEQLESFNRLNTSLIIQEMPEDSFAYKLYAMYLSYIPESKMSYPVNMNIDNRGVFSELIKTENNGQVSVNIAKPGVTRGQHWHNTKWEIFIVVSGHGLIEEREIGTDRVISFEVRGEDMRAVIMLPGYTHSITNLEKDRDLVTIMYANEHFDPGKPDTFFEEV